MNETLYTIQAELNEAINKGLNPDTGELENFGYITALMMKREEKIDNICSYIKNQRAEAAAIAEEEKALSERRKRKERRADCLEEYLKSNLEPGERFESARNQVKWTKGEAVEVDEAKLPKKYWRKRVIVEPDKAGIKTLIKQGMKIKGAQLIKTIGMRVK